MMEVAYLLSLDLTNFIQVSQNYFPFFANLIYFFMLTDRWIDTLSSKEHLDYMTAANKARTDESLRKVDKFNADYLGMPGTFRTLNVD